MTFDENEHGCPHCGALWEANDDDQYIDDFRDKCESTCPECGKRYKLRCIHVAAYFEALKCF